VPSVDSTPSDSWTELCVETATLGAFVAREGLRGVLPDDAFVKLLMSGQRAARTALKAAMK
jgi:hypothetical protein